LQFKSDASRQAPGILDEKHESEERKVIEASQPRVQRSLERNDGHPGTGKRRVEYGYCG
jgi:hypothetical protein